MIQSNYKNKIWLQEKYCDEKLTLQNIANSCGIAKDSLYYWLKKFQIKKQPKKICKFCGKEFCDDSRAHSMLYCSSECAKEAQRISHMRCSKKRYHDNIELCRERNRRHYQLTKKRPITIKKICPICNKEFQDSSICHQRKYCSVECHRTKSNEVQRIKARKRWRNLNREEKDEINLKNRINGTNKRKYQKVKLKKGLSDKGSPEYSAKLSKAQRKRKGPLAGGWIDGRTPEYKRIRASIEFRLWREAVFERDNWICQKCNQRGGKLHPHHIYNFTQYPKLRFNVDNGITLCVKCHIEFHKIYGFKNNTIKQIKEFII